MKIFTAAVAPLAAAAVFILKNKLLKLSVHFPECVFYKESGYYCPACGNTRCVKALFNGEILLALRNNITIPILIVLVFLLYVELVADILGKKLRLLPRKGLFWGLFISAFMIYYIIRNIFPSIAPI